MIYGIDKYLGEPREEWLSHKMTSNSGKGW